MRRLYESILSKTKVGAVKLNFDDLKSVYSSATLNNHFKMDVMYKDARKIRGEEPRTHAEAFAIIFCDQPIKRSDFDEMTTGKPGSNDAANRFLRERFKKYLLPDASKNKFNFYCTKSLWFDNTYAIGILDHDRHLNRTEILSFKTPK